ncbi:MAG: hypothetical protein K2P26_09295 [Oscillospiraceae bacterium]|nr:hypothetical protein [Oscillospiraceae bacterium]
MEKYQRAYAYLFGQMDDALSLMEHGNLLNFGRVRSILQNALLKVEEDMITEPEMDPAESLRLEAELLGHKLRRLDVYEFVRHVEILREVYKKR